jgi:hypothetical protein
MFAGVPGKLYVQKRGDEGSWAVELEYEGIQMPLWFADTGRDLHSRWLPCKALNADAELPALAFTLLTKDAEYDVDFVAPTLAGVGNFPF